MGLHNTLRCSFGTSDYPGVVSVQEVEETYIFGRPSILIRASRAWWTWMRNWGQSLSWIFLSSRIGFVLTVFCNFADCKKLWKATPTHWVHLYKCKYKSRQMQKQNNVKMQAALECDFDWHRPKLSTRRDHFLRGGFPTIKWYHDTKRNRQGMLWHQRRNKCHRYQSICHAGYPEQ